MQFRLWSLPKPCFNLPTRSNPEPNPYHHLPQPIHHHPPAHGNTPQHSHDHCTCQPGSGHSHSHRHQSAHHPDDTECGGDNDENCDLHCDQHAGYPSDDCDKDCDDDMGWRGWGGMGKREDLDEVEGSDSGVE